MGSEPAPLKALAGALLADAPLAEFELAALKPSKLGSMLPMGPAKLMLGKLKGKRLDKMPLGAVTGVEPGVGKVEAWAEPSMGMLDALVLVGAGLLALVLGPGLVELKLLPTTALEEPGMYLGNSPKPLAMLGVSSFTRLAPSKRLAQ